MRASETILPRALSPDLFFDRARLRLNVREALPGIQVVGDTVTAFGALAFAYWLRFSLFRPYLPYAEAERVFSSYLVYCFLGAALYLIVAANVGLYDGRRSPEGRGAFDSIVRCAAIWFFTFLGVTLVVQLHPPISRVYSAFACGSMLACQLGWRLLLARALRLVNLSHGLKQRVLVVGLGPTGMAMAARLKSERGAPYHFMGFVQGRETGGERDPGDPLLGELQQLDELCEQYRPDQILVADPALTRAEVLEIARTCERRFIAFLLASTTFEIFTSCLQLRQLAGAPVLGVVDLPANRIFNRLAKRAVDLVGASVGLALSAPLLFVLAALIKRESRGPVFYRQIRVGQHGRPFEILKLRSMRLDAEQQTGPRWCEANDPRRTRIGEFMRRTNLDELPQFWNVLRGEMSLVGPRPERPELIPQFVTGIPYYQSRHSVKPGMTGWAQVNGLRGNTSLAERIRYDLHYIENWSLGWDLLIQLQTFYKVRNAY